MGGGGVASNFFQSEHPMNIAIKILCKRNKLLSKFAMDLMINKYLLEY